MLSQQVFKAHIQDHMEQNEQEGSNMQQGWLIKVWSEEMLIITSEKRGEA